MNKKRKIALIIGGLGQDGSYIADLLLKKNYKIVCISSQISNKKKWRHKFLKIEKKIIYKKINILNSKKLSKLFNLFTFDEVYNFAAQSLVEKSFALGKKTILTNCYGLYNLLENIKDKNIKFYHSSSSEIFGDTRKKFVSLKSNTNPTSIYAASKIFGQNLLDVYKKKYNINACYGILFNHESPLRDKNFVSKKICKSIVEIFNKKRKYLNIGNIYIKRDWGFSKEYMNIVWKNMQKKKLNNFLLGTGKLYTIKYFIEKCFEHYNIHLKWIYNKKHILGINKKNNQILVKSIVQLYRKNDFRNFTLKNKRTPKIRTSLEKLINLMLKTEQKIFE